MPKIGILGDPTIMQMYNVPTNYTEPHIIEHTLCRIYLSGKNKDQLMLDQRFSTRNTHYFGREYMNDIILGNCTRKKPIGTLKDIVYDFKLLFANKEYCGPHMIGSEILLLDGEECGEIRKDYSHNVLYTKYGQEIVEAYILEHFIKHGFYTAYKIRGGRKHDAIEVIITFCPISIYGEDYYKNEFTTDYKYKIYWLRKFIKSHINQNIEYEDFGYNKYIHGNNIYLMMRYDWLLPPNVPVYYADHFGRVTMHPDISKYYERAMCSLEGRYGLTGAEYKVPIRRQCYGNPFYQVLFNFNDVNVRDYFKNTYTNPLYSKSKPRQAIQFV